MSICFSPQLNKRFTLHDLSPLNEDFSANSSEKFFSSQEQMSESGLSNDEDSKVEQVQDGRWTREEHYRFLKAVAIYGREVHP